MSDNTNQNPNQQVSDDQELAKVLQGMQQQTRTVAASDPADKGKNQEGQTSSQGQNGSGMQYEQTPQSGGNKTEAAPQAADKDSSAKSDSSSEPQKQESSQQQPAAGAQQPTPPQPTSGASAQNSAGSSQAAPTTLPTPSASESHTASQSAGSGLESLKKEALEELRPLVDKLDLPPKEKFDTMLLIIRSTDDRDLLQPAHETAKKIEDENQRAEALLDIVKEVDYFASQKSA